MYYISNQYVLECEIDMQKNAQVDLYLPELELFRNHSANSSICKYISGNKIKKCKLLMNKIVIINFICG